MQKEIEQCHQITVCRYRATPIYSFFFPSRRGPRGFVEAARLASFNADRPGRSVRTRRNRSPYLTTRARAPQGASGRHPLPEFHRFSVRSPAEPCTHALIRFYAPRPCAIDPFIGRPNSGSLGGSSNRRRHSTQSQKLMTPQHPTIPAQNVASHHHVPDHSHPSRPSNPHSQPEPLVHHRCDNGARWYV